MAVPSSGFSLTDVNDELGTSGQSLVTCISNSGESFDSLLDFANYSAVANITVTYDLSTTITTITDSSTAKNFWRRVDIIPSGSGREGAQINFKATYNLSKGTGALTGATFYYGVGTHSTNEPTWIIINSANSSGTGTVVVDDGEYLFVRLLCVRKNLGLDDWAAADITLINGNVIAPNTGTVTASGSPLTWSVTIGNPG